MFSTKTISDVVAGLIAILLQGFTIIEARLYPMRNSTTAGDHTMLAELGLP